MSCWFSQSGPGGTSAASGGSCCLWVTGVRVKVASQCNISQMWHPKTFPPPLCWCWGAFHGSGCGFTSPSYFDSLLGSCELCRCCRSVCAAGCSARECSPNRCAGQQFQLLRCSQKVPGGDKRNSAAQHHSSEECLQSPRANKTNFLAVIGAFTQLKCKTTCVFFLMSLFKKENTWREEAA